MSFTKQQIILIISIILVVGLAGLWLYQGLKSSPNKGITLVVWGVSDDKDIWDELTKPYAQETQNKVVYVKKNEKTYENDLINALASGTGPDVFYFHNTWFLKHYDKVVPAPKSIATDAIIEENYVSTVKKDFVSGSQVIALPLFIDSLALFYNPLLLDQAAIPFPPKTWEELLLMAPKLTKFDDRKNIIYSAVALGTGNNIANATDILMLLMMQSGAVMVNTKTLQADFGTNPSGTLKFYTQFANNQTSVYSWNSSLANSLDEFARAKVAFVFGYAKDIAYIKSIAPYFSFKIALMPQPQKSVLRQDFANYWGLTVSKQSRYPNEAWQMIAKVTSDSQSQWYSQRNNLSPAKKNLISLFSNDPILGVFTRQAYTATNWYQPNTQGVKTLFNETIENLNKNRLTPEGAVQYLYNQVNRMFDEI
jgi:multiple sugar transport system substrate-binding protein